MQTEIITFFVQHPVAGPIQKSARISFNGDRYKDGNAARDAIVKYNEQLNIKQSLFVDNKLTAEDFLKWQEENEPKEIFNFENV